jgi:hypothetical protein
MARAVVALTPVPAQMEVTQEASTQLRARARLLVALTEHYLVRGDEVFNYRDPGPGGFSIPVDARATAPDLQRPQPALRHGLSRRTLASLVAAQLHASVASFELKAAQGTGSMWTCEATSPAHVPSPTRDLVLVGLPRAVDGGKVVAAILQAFDELEEAPTSSPLTPATDEARLRDLGVSVHWEPRAGGPQTALIPMYLRCSSVEDREAVYTVLPTDRSFSTVTAQRCWSWSLG